MNLFIRAKCMCSISQATRYLEQLQCLYPISTIATRMSENIELPMDSYTITTDDVTTVANRFFASDNVEIIDFDLKPISKQKLGFFGKHASLTVIPAQDRNGRRDGDSKKSENTCTFFVKSVRLDWVSYSKSIFLCEAQFFRDVVPKLLHGYGSEPWAAKCYLVNDDVLILEDLGSQGFKCSKKLQACHVESALASLARLHACSMKLEKELKKPLIDEYSGFFKEKAFVSDVNFANEWLKAGIEVIEAVADRMKLNPEYVSKAYELTLEKFKPVEGQRNVLCHGDLWSNNMMFSEDGMHCRLVDFQTVCYRSYIIDLLGLMYLNSPRDMRQKMERQFVKSYHSVLQDNLRNFGFGDGEIISLEDVFRDVDDKRICGLVMAVQYYPLVSLNEKISAEYSKDVESFNDYLFKSRKDLVLRSMNLDSDYRSSIEESVRELIEYMKTVNIT